MSAPVVQGWCPGALRPMLSGDGLLVRIRPPGGVLTPAQAAGIAEASLTHGNGIFDLSSRANLQLRGVTADSHGPLIEDLRSLGLIDPDIGTESLRNLIITPFRTSRLPSPTCPPSPTLPHTGARSAPGDDSRDETAALAAILTAALARMPPLPGKFGFALDTGPRPVLHGASADIRVERSAEGRLILRPDGHPLGRAVTDPGSGAVGMVNWFVNAGGVAEGRGRMAALIARGVVPEGCDTAPADPLPQPVPGLGPDGALVALAFGQMRAATLAALAATGHDLRLTPWRMLLLAGAAALPDLPGLITMPDDPLLRVSACTGAPGCPQARGPTRDLARDLARALAPRAGAGHLHVSGCSKGCAHPAAAPVTLVASSRGYDLVRDGTAADTPSLTDLAPDRIAALLKAPDAPPL